MLIVEREARKARNGWLALLVAGLIAPGGPYEVLFDVDDVLVAKRKV